MGEKLTKAQRKTLEWFAARDWASTFGRGGPQLHVIRKLETAGLVKRVGHDPGRFGFTRFAISDQGRAALAES
jgi:hypothetical protein